MLWVGHPCSVCMPGVEEDEISILLAMTLIQKTPQVDCMKVMQPEEGSNHDRVWGPDVENK